MATQQTVRGEDSSGGSETGVRGRVRAAAADGTGAMLAGGALLAAAVRGRGSRSTLQGLLGVILVGAGVRQRRSAVDTGSDHGGDVTLDTGGTGGEASTEARANVERQGTGGQGEGNPREVGDAPGAHTEEDEGDVQFTRDHADDVRPEPGGEASGEADPRRDDAGGPDDDAEVEIDISEAAMAEEAGEAAGPTGPQSQPTTTKDAETTPTDHEDGNEADDEDRESVETEGGATVHTDTMEAGNMDIDVDDVTDPDDELNEEPSDSEDQTSSRLENDEGDSGDGDRAADADEADDEE